MLNTWKHHQRTLKLPSSDTLVFSLLRLAPANEMCSFYKLLHLHLSPINTNGAFKQFFIHTLTDQVIFLNKKPNVDKSKFTRCLLQYKLPYLTKWITSKKFYTLDVAYSSTHNFSRMFNMAYDSINIAVLLNVMLKLGMPRKWLRQPERILL